MKTNLTLLLLLFGLNTWAQTPCVDGFAAGYPCNNVDLLSMVAPEEMWGTVEDQFGLYLNDVWGWTDSETGKEYALVGLIDGTAFVDITDPVNPIFVGKLMEHIHNKANGPTGRDILHEESAWRSFKVYKNYVFVVSEQSHHGIQIFDLTKLRNVTNPPVEFTEDTNYSGVGNAHNVVINEESGFAYAVGVNTGEQCFGGGLHMINIQDPLNPVFAGCFDNDGYTHDALCIIYRGPDADYYGKEICFASNEETVTIVDVSDKSNPIQISRTSYPDAGYTHQGWLTPDQRYFLTNDEFDELNTGNNTRTIMWDFLDLDNPVVIGDYFGPVEAIDHNLYTKGNLVFEANYLSGIRVINSSGIGQGTMEEVGFFDTHPETNSAQFDGTWNVYPYFPSGNIVASDISKGLFVLRPEQNIHITDFPTSVGICAGDEGHLAIGLANAVSPQYQWQIKTESGDYTDVANDDSFAGSQSATLTIKSASENLDGKFFRCIATDQGEVLYSPLAIIESTTLDFNFSVVSYGEVSFESITNNTSGVVWDFGDGITSTEANPTHNFTESGSFTVKLMISSEACGDISVEKEVQVIVLGLEDATNKMRLFPNPAESMVSIQSSKSLLNAQIQVLSLNGKVIQEALVTESANSYNLSLPTLSTGMYLIQIKTESGQSQHKLFIK